MFGYQSNRDFKRTLQYYVRTFRTVRHQIYRDVTSARAADTAKTLGTLYIRVPRLKIIALGPRKPRSSSNFTSAAHY